MARFRTRRFAIALLAFFALAPCANAQQQDEAMFLVAHPAFRDLEYRARRDAIAAQALAWRGGPAPRVAYTSAEHAVWRRGRTSHLSKAWAGFGCR